MSNYGHAGQVLDSARGSKMFEKIKIVLETPLKALGTVWLLDYFIDPFVAASHTDNKDLLFDAFFSDINDRATRSYTEKRLQRYLEENGPIDNQISLSIIQMSFTPVISCAYINLSHIYNEHSYEKVYSIACALSEEFRKQNIVIGVYEHKHSSEIALISPKHKPERWKNGTISRHDNNHQQSLFLSWLFKNALLKEITEQEIIDIFNLRCLWDAQTLLKNEKAPDINLCPAPF